VVVSATTAALISGGAAIVSQDMSSSAARDTQALAFEHQRTLATDDELRELLYDAAIALDDATNEAGRAHVRWRDSGQALRKTPKFEAVFLEASQNGIRLRLRLGRATYVNRSYDGALKPITDVWHTMKERSPTPEQMSFADDLLFNRLSTNIDAFERYAEDLINDRDRKAAPSRKYPFYEKAP